MSSTVAIVDYSLGNLESVHQAFAHVGTEATVTGDPARLREARALVLPGVGAFGDGMHALKERGLIEVLHEFAASGRPLIGICLGMQFLLRSSNEFGDHEGLGLIQGSVRRFPSPELGDDGRYGPGSKVPQVGWNRVDPPRERPDAWAGSPLDGLEPGAQMYFMHSFYVEPDSADVVLCESEYSGVRFCSALQQENIVGFQFHPERSAEDGLAIYRGLASWIEGA